MTGCKGQWTRFDRKRLEMSGNARIIIANQTDFCHHLASTRSFCANQQKRRSLFAEKVVLFGICWSNAGTTRSKLPAALSYFAFENINELRTRVSMPRKVSTWFESD